MNKNKYIRLFSILLVFSLLIGTIGWISTREHSEPENTIADAVEQLNIEFLEGGQNADSSDTTKTEENTPTPPPEDEQTKEPPTSEPSDRPSTENLTPPPEQPPKNTEATATQPPASDIRHNGQATSPPNDEKNTNNNNDNSTVNPSSQAPEHEESDDGTATPSTEEPGDFPIESLPPGGSGSGDVKHGIVTDLYNHIITTSELTNDTLHFYAYYSDPSVDAKLTVNYRHINDRTLGKNLSPQGQNYSTKLQLGINYITLYYTDAQGKRNYTQYVITYEAEKATSDNPTVGAHPPIIKTGLDTWEGMIKTRSFTFIVDAKTWEGKRIYSNHIEVYMDGNLIINPTGDGIYEYTLYFPVPIEGNIGHHTVTVLAWDDEGNSAYVQYEVEFESFDDGEVIGSVHVVLDATTIGLGILDEIDLELIQGEPAAASILRMLEECGYTADYAGTPDIGFYLRGITRSDTFYGATVDERLNTLITRDEITLQVPCTRDCLKEHDFTMGSGFMYSVNDTLYPGKGMSEWFLNDGDTLYIRYTLAYGKDIGGSISGYGKLSNYCGKWINDEFIPLEHDYKHTGHMDATETEGAYDQYICSKCKEVKKEYDE